MLPADAEARAKLWQTVVNQNIPALSSYYFQRFSAYSPQQSQTHRKHGREDFKNEVIALQQRSQYFRCPRCTSILLPYKTVIISMKEIPGSDTEYDVNCITCGFSFAGLYCKADALDV